MNSLPEDLALHYLHQALGALEHLHHRHVLHLDVKGMILRLWIYMFTVQGNRSPDTGAIYEGLEYFNLNLINSSSLCPCGLLKKLLYCRYTDTWIQLV